MTGELLVRGKNNDCVRIRGVIFDVDGTLLDSMGIWKDAGARYLQSIGVEPEDGLAEILFPMSIKEGVEYVRERYGLPYTTAEIITGVLETVKGYYFYEAPLREGVLQVLAFLKEQGIPMVVATSSERTHVEAAFRRLGIDSYFRQIFTCSEVGEGKNQPLIYFKAAEELGTATRETLVFEDALFAVRTAGEAGFLTAGICDRYSKDSQKAVKREAWVYLREMGEFLEAVAGDSAGDSF